MSDIGDDDYYGGGYDEGEYGEYGEGEYDEGGYDEGGYVEGGYDEGGYDEGYDNQQEQVMSYKQYEQVSYTHYLLMETNQLKPFADGVRNALSERNDFSDNEFNQTLTQILNFVGDNSEKIGHMEYKNPNIFVLAFLSMDNTKPVKINTKKLKKYSNSININDVIRYCTLIEQMSQ